LAALEYEKITGEEFTDEKQAEFFTYMNKENNMNPRKAMRDMLKPVVQRKADEAEVEKKAEARALQILKDRGEIAGDQDVLPVPTREAAAGSLKRMLEQSAVEEGDIESLAMVGARKAAAELRSEGKG
jgi:hypothetical protein